MGGSDSVPVVVPSPLQVMACAGCVPTNRSILRYIAIGILVMAIAIAVMIWFTDTPALIYVIFALGILTAILAAAQAFFINQRCGPCVCG